MKSISLRFPHLKPLLAAWLSWGLLQACNVSPSPSGSELKIIAGQDAQPGDQVSLSTVAVIYSDELFAASGRVCSGVLLDQRTVLTAAHCFQDMPDCKVVLGLDTKGKDAKVIEGRCMHHPLNDLTLISLAEDVLAPYRGVSYLGSGDALNAGQEIILAGYGVDRAPDEAHADASRGRLRFTQQFIDTVGSDYPGFYYINQPGQANALCSGDSGGPAYVRSPSGSLRLAGLSLSGDRDCSQMGNLLDIRSFGTWIKATQAALASSSGPKPSRFPFCVDQASDADGDGWGWENNASCLVRK